MQELEKILEEIKEATRQEDTPIYREGIEVDGYVRQSVVEDIIRKHMNDGWISVEERLPEAGEHVIYARVTIDHGTIRQRILAKWNGEEFKSIYRTRIYNRIVAWKKCSPPKPYRPERRDNHDRERSN